MAAGELSLFLDIIALGLNVADQVLGFNGVRQAVEFNREIEEVIHQQQVNVQQLRDLISSSTLSLKEAIFIGIDKVISKMEQDKVEELISRINNIDLLLRMKKDTQLLPYTLQLKESVDYAKNRLDEGKKSWLMPYMVGLGMVCATFSYLGEQEALISQELETLVLNTKKIVLTEVTKALLEEGQDIPWDLVKNILNNYVGSIEQYVALLPAYPVNHVLSTQTKLSIQTGSIDCPSCKKPSLVTRDTITRTDMICPHCGCSINIAARKAQIRWN